MSDISLNESARQSIVVAISSSSIAFLGEETDVVALCADDDCPLDLYISLTHGDQE